MIRRASDPGFEAVLGDVLLDTQIGLLFPRQRRMAAGPYDQTLRSIRQLEPGCSTHLSKRLL